MKLKLYKYQPKNKTLDSDPLEVEVSKGSNHIILPTVNNVEYILNKHDVKVRFNELKNRVEIKCPGKCWSTI